MTETLLHQLAEKIAREQFLLQWPIHALMLAIALVVGFGAAYLGSYAKRRGETFATKADFADLLSQQKATTAVTEEVKARVSQADWATRELKTLRRVKLEEFLQAVYELQNWQDLEKSARVFDSGKDPGPSPLPKVELLVTLYFPELRAAAHECCQIHRRMAIEILQAHSSLLSTANDHSAQQNLRQQFANEWKALYQSQLESISVIERQSREIMAGLVGA